MSEGKLAPAHRQIAEFLAAKYVSELLNEGLPLERILALITGFDGELMPSFNIFACWLAIHNKQSRNKLSQLDPSGLIYAADQQTYSPDEKRDIVLNLRRESYWNPWCIRALSHSPGFGGIVSLELESVFREILTNSERGNEHQSYVMLLMQMLADGEPLPTLSNVLEKMVRDPSWDQGVRCAALDVLTSYRARGCFASETLTSMVVDIEDGCLNDPEDELLGILLKALYPNVLSMAEIQQYLRAPKLTNVASEYAEFWTSHVPKESTPGQLAELLDGISEQFAEYRPFMVGEVGSITMLGQLPIKLLDRILRETRWRNPIISVAVDRLYKWLGIVSAPGLRFSQTQVDLIRFSLRRDSDGLKSLIAHGVETCLRRGEDCMGLVDRYLFGTRPWKYGRWCVEMALAAKEDEASVFYLQELLDCLMDGEYTDGLTVEGARVDLAANEALVSKFDEMVTRRSHVESVTESWSVAGTEPAEDTPEQRVWQAQLEAQASELSAGRGTPDLLHQAAEAYLGIQGKSAGKTNRQRLGNLVGSRVDLIDLLIAGIEGTVTRNDLPGCDDVVRLFDRVNSGEAGAVMPDAATTRG